MKMNHISYLTSNVDITIDDSGDKNYDDNFLATLEFAAPHILSPYSLFMRSTYFAP